jgi:hypothetical protein
MPIDTAQAQRYGAGRSINCYETGTGLKYNLTGKRYAAANNPAY